MSERLHPWVIGTEYLGSTIVRFHFAGSAVRDVDLQAVLSNEELESLRAEGLVGEVRTTVMWPNGLHISPEMLDLIFAGFGARKGWPQTVAPPSADAPFPVPSLEDMGVRTFGADPAERVLSPSSAQWRHEKIDGVLDALRRHVDDLIEWWRGAHDELRGPLEGERRRSVLNSGMGAAFLVRMGLEGLEEMLRDAGVGDALVASEPEIQQLVERASRWNDAWVYQQADAAGKVIDPLENPDGFCEERRARLTGGTGSVEESTS